MGTWVKVDRYKPASEKLIKELAGSSGWILFEVGEEPREGVTAPTEAEIKKYQIKKDMKRHVVVIEISPFKYLEKKL